MGIFSRFFSGGEAEPYEGMSYEEASDRLEEVVLLDEAYTAQDAEYDGIEVADGAYEAYTHAEPGVWIGGAENVSDEDVLAGYLGL